jgi:hypothetical protein
MRKAIGVLLVVLMFSGCAIFKQYNDLGPLDKAKVGVETMSSWYYNTHLELEKQYNEADDEGKALLNSKVFPLMDGIKPKIIAYNSLVILWEETNTKPDSIEQLMAEIQKLVLGVIDVMDELK